MNRSSDQKGFALLLVMLLVAMIALGALSLLDMINLDIVLVGQERRADKAREAAEGGLMEMLNDFETPDTLPGLDDPDLQEKYTPPVASPFLAEGRSYEGHFEMLRIVPLAESSHSLTRAVVHGLHVEGFGPNREASSGVDAEIYRVVGYRPGTVLPKRHAR